jgi:acetyl-CoA C-acetyltransferase
MARFTDVAAANPYAWFPIARTAEELVTPSPTNRMVSYPYTKYLNAILNVDQCAALVITSVATARDLGIPEDRWVYWWGGNHAKEEAWYASTRPDFASTPSILDSHLGALANAGTTLDDIDLIDFYSCFPAPVEMACKMLGLDLDDPRGFTITGGLPYGGGPGSSYTLHSLATMADRVRERPESTALITGNGFYLTKHAASVWSGKPFAGEALRSTFTGPQPSEALVTAPRDPVPANGRGTIETYTVVYDRDGSPARGIVLGALDSGERFLANTPADRDLLEAFVAEEQVGNSGRVTTGEAVSVFTPS